ncbi:MAG: hypothetical protein PHP92_05695, partial [Candidatus Nanoarchaeia archaeon]|nr:hypothetical protein [Candidatus Nanoarchaeia archaeon]
MLKELTEQVCNRCKILKPISEYNKDVHTLSGFKKVCKSCTHEIYEENKKKPGYIEKKRASFKKYRKNNPANAALKNEYLKNKYWSDPEFREKIKMMNNKYYCERLKKEGEEEEKRKIELPEFIKKQMTPEHYLERQEKYKDILESQHINLMWCSCCFEYYPANTDFFLPQRGSEDGFFEVCKACTNDARKFAHWKA